MELESGGVLFILSLGRVSSFYVMQVRGFKCASAACWLQSTKSLKLEKQALSMQGCVLITLPRGILKASD